MNIDKAVLRFAGLVTFISAILAWRFGAGWLLLTGFVGLNMLQSSFTGFCPLAIILKKMGVQSGEAFK